jgi:hypothetical protein
MTLRTGSDMVVDLRLFMIAFTTRLSVYTLCEKDV